MHMHVSHLFGSLEGAISMDDAATDKWKCGFSVSQTHFWICYSNIHKLYQLLTAYILINQYLGKLAQLEGENLLWIQLTFELLGTDTRANLSSHMVYVPRSINTS